MKVFVVIAGEDNEGGAVEGVFHAREPARQFVKKQFVGRDFDAEYVAVTPSEVDRWENAGCDWVEIQPHEVQ